MPTAQEAKPIIATIYVRHSAGCKHSGNESYKSCKCRKSLYWNQDGKRQRISANTRRWDEAENVKREIEDRLNGRRLIPVPTAQKSKTIADASLAFLAEKKVEGLSADLISKYTLWLGRFEAYMATRGVVTVNGFTRELITTFCSRWPVVYPSALTRQKLRERYRSFMKFCVASGYIDKAPEWPKIQSEAKAPTLPLTEAEYSRLLDAVYVTVKAPTDGTVENQSHEYWCKRVTGLFQLMRWSGLSIMDALTLERSRVVKVGPTHRIVTQRTKTGTDVSVVVPTAIAAELVAIPNENDRYLFWSGVGEKKSICGNWGKRFIAPAFAEARIESEGRMKAHRLRDTFACDLLSKGVPIQDVSKLLGHTSVRTTEKSYAPWAKGRQDRLDELVMGTWEKAA